GEDAFRTLVDASELTHSDDAKGADEKRALPGLTLGPAERMYLSTLLVTSTAISSLLNGVSFIGPLRRHAQRLYEMSGEHPPDVGTSGEFAPEILLRRRDPEVGRSVN